MSTAPVQIDTVATTLGPTAIVHLPAGLTLRPLGVDDSYWRHASEQAEFADGRILSVFEYTETWTWRERHPNGDELVLLLSGRVGLELGGPIPEHVIELAAGECAIVPEDTWHRAVIHTPSRMLFVTPTPARTEHQRASCQDEPDAAPAPGRFLGVAGDADRRV